MLDRLNPFHKEKSLEDWEEEDEKVSHEYSIAQKKAAIAEARKRGVKASAFTSIGSLIKWLRTH